MSAITTIPQAISMLQRAQWAARAYSTYDQRSVRRIVESVAAAAHEQAAHYAQWAVRETRLGRVSDKTRKNRAYSSGALDLLRGDDQVTPRIADDGGCLVPRPAGVVLGLTPITSPVAAVYLKVILALLTRNALVLNPHPGAAQCSADAARTLAAVAVAAGAPDGIVQTTDGPGIEVAEAMMRDPRVDLIVATGGARVLRSVHTSGRRAIGIRSGSVPVLVDHSADLDAAARRTVDAKSFDNSLSGDAESVLILTEASAEPFIARASEQGAALMNADDARRISALAYPGGILNPAVAGKSARWIAKRAAVDVPSRTKVLLMPFDLVVPEQPLAVHTPAPILGVMRAADTTRGIDAARAVVRIDGARRRAVIHSSDPRTVMDFAARVGVDRVSVNGADTEVNSFCASLATEALLPGRLVTWMTIAVPAGDPLTGEFEDLDPSRAPEGAVPPYPRASNARPADGRIA